MEGERAFIQQLKGLQPELLKEEQSIAFRYSLGGGVKKSNDWEPLGPAGYYDTFGPELSFAQTLRKSHKEPIAIAKFTHSGSQIIDWTPAGSVARSRNLYPSFINFIKESITSLEAKGQTVELAGIFYHLGENDMSFPPFRQDAAGNLQSMIAQSRLDLEQPALPWIVSQQPPTNDERVNNLDVTGMIEAVAATDPHLIHIKAFDLPQQEKKLVLDTAGVLELGRVMARGYPFK